MRPVLAILATLALLAPATVDPASARGVAAARPVARVTGARPRAPAGIRRIRRRLAIRGQGRDLGVPLTYGDGGYGDGRDGAAIESTVGYGPGGVAAAFGIHGSAVRDASGDRRCRQLRFWEDAPGCPSVD